MKLLVIFLALFTMATTANAEVFDIPANGAWVKVQDGKIIQWSAISSTESRTRIDLVSYVEEGKRTTFYMIRSACSNDKIISSVIEPGNKIGVGLDCNGNTIATDAAMLNKVQKLPPAAMVLIKQ